MGKRENFDKLKILIIDDDEDICSLLNEFCTLLNLSCKTLQNPRLIEDILNKEKFNIIFLDQNFPEIKGIDLIKKGYIRPEDYYIILMTGERLSEEIVNNMLTLGINEFIQKPVTLSDFRKALFKAKSFILEKQNFLEAIKKLEKTTMEFILDNDISIIGTVAKMILRNIEGMNFTENPKILLTAIIEALTNAIIHGNLEISSSLKDESFEIFSKEVEKRANDEKFKNRKVYVKSYLDKKIFKIKIQDDGNGFNWRETLKNLEKSNILTSYGKGIKIIKNSFDEVFWNEKGNEIIMVKHPLSSSVK